MAEQPSGWTWDDYALMGLIALAAIAWFELCERRQIEPMALWALVTGQVNYDDMGFYGPEDKSGEQG